MRRMTVVADVSSNAAVAALLLAMLSAAIWAESGGEGITVVVSNKRTGLENAVYVRCYDGMNQTNVQLIFPEKNLTLQVPAGRKDGLRATASFCIGTYTKFYGMGASFYHIYDSRRKEFQACDSGCHVLANDTSFYRWDLQKKVWDIIQPSVWL